MDNVTCHVHSDCTSNNDQGIEIFKVCYLKVSWSDEENFCDCSSWYGFTGDDCDQVSTANVYFKVSLIMQLLLSFVGVVALVSELSRYLTPLSRFAIRSSDYKKGLGTVFLIL